MPLPKKKPGEPTKKFVSRAMSSDKMKKEFPDPKQRVAVAYSQAKRKKKK